MIRSLISQGVKIIFQGHDNMYKIEVVLASLLWISRKVESIFQETNAPFLDTLAILNFPDWSVWLQLVANT